MKRYRVTSFDFDARANSLKFDLDKKNSDLIKNSIEQEFGVQHFEQKLKNFKDLECYFPSVLAFHNKFMRQIRTSFVMGAYYPALTGTCALGERVLNHLLLRLRSYFKSEPEYKSIHSKKSIDDWDFLINVLKKWGILLPDVAEKFKKLKKIRHEFAIHFNPITDSNDRVLALDAIRLLSDIIQNQFGVLGIQPWFIRGTKGCFFIKKQYENNPFVKEIYLPSCNLVGPKHTIEMQSGKFIVKDDFVYEDKEISDEEFAKFFS